MSDLRRLLSESVDRLVSDEKVRNVVKLVVLIGLVVFANDVPSVFRSTPCEPIRELSNHSEIATYVIRSLESLDG